MEGMKYQQIDVLSEDKGSENEFPEGNKPATLGMPGCGHSMARECAEEDADYYRNIKAIEGEWYEESQERFANAKWYARPSKSIMYFAVSIHSLSSTILMGPLVILMLESICKKETVAVVHHHGAGGMDMSGGHGNSSGGDGGGMNMALFKRMDMGGGGKMGTIEGCKNTNSQQDLSDVQTILSILSGVLGFSLSGKFGQLSDRFGRVYVFKIFSVINLIHSVCLIVYFQFFKSYHEFWMILLLSTTYFSGGVMSLIANGNSYLNDIVKTEDRTVSISLLMSFVYTTLGVGPLVGSFAVKISGGSNILTLYLSVAFGLISTVIIFTILKESRHPAAMELAKDLYLKKNATRYHSNIFVNFILGTFQSILTFFKPIKRLWIPRTRSGSIIPRINVLTLVFIDNFNMAVTIGTMSPLILFSIWKYKWTSVEIGYYMSIGGFGKALVLLLFAPVFFRLLQTRLGFNVNGNSVDMVDKISIFSSLIFVTLSLILVVSINNSSGVYLSSVLQSLSGMISPVTQSAIAKYSNKTEAGEMFGAIALIRHLSMLVFPIIFLQIYSHTIKINAKLFLYLPLVVSFFTIVASMLGLKSDERKTDDEFSETAPLEAAS